jgi:hypothetical protein
VVVGVHDPSSRQASIGRSGARLSSPRIARRRPW